jgi:hypothetical protein
LHFLGTKSQPLINTLTIYFPIFSAKYLSKKITRYSVLRYYSRKTTSCLKKKQKKKKPQKIKKKKKTPQKKNHKESNQFFIFYFLFFTSPTPLYAPPLSVLIHRSTFSSLSSQQPSYILPIPPKPSNQFPFLNSKSLFQQNLGIFNHSSIFL